MITNEMNVAYKAACIKEMQNDLLREFQKVMGSTEITSTDKNWAFNMAMNMLKQVQKK